MRAMPWARGPRPYSPADRVDQLRRFARACQAAAELLSAHGWEGLGGQYAARAEHAQHLLDDGFGSAQLRELGSARTLRPGWLHPRFAEGVAREAWQEDLGRHVDEAERVALELRAVARYGPQR